MAKIYVFDATAADEHTLKNTLSDHELVCNSESISVDNCPTDAEIISVFVTSSVTRELITSMPKLRLIACRSTGFNNIDLQTAAEHHVIVTNVPTYGEHTVAEYAFMLTLALSRKLIPTYKSVFDAQIELTTLCGFDLNGKTFGIVGAGRIGQTAARIAKGFGMRVVAYDPYPVWEKSDEIGFEWHDLDTVLRESDVLSLHAPATPENNHLMNAERLKLMKPTAVLINTARGELVDTTALLHALQAKQLAGAALDVIEGEKLLDIDEELLLLRREQIPAEQLQYSMELHILQKLPNTILTPHNAFNTTEAIERINNTTAGNITAFLHDNPTNIVKTPPKPAGQLIIVRHGESEWNALGKWTGSTDVHLSEKGFREAALLGQTMQDLHLDYAYTSQQIRALETLEGILDSSRQFDTPFERTEALNERDYGEYTGKNKWEMRDLLGEEKFNQLRRDWDFPVPNGETLKMVSERVVPFYKTHILPRLQRGETVLIASHGNAIRALVKHLESISDQDVAHVEMIFGTILTYSIDSSGHVVAKDERHIDSPAPPA